MSLLVLLVALFALSASAETVSGTCGATASDNVTWSFDSATGKLTIGGEGAMADFGAVTDQPWNAYASSITSVEIADTVTTVGNRAFGSLSKLTSCVVPDAATKIGYGAFSGCSSLESIVIGNSVTEIGTYAFSGCSKLKEAHIPGSVVTIQNYAFQACKAMTSVTIEEGVQTIYHGAFNGCTGLTEIVLPHSLKTFGYTAKDTDGVFKGCTNLKKVTFLSANVNITTCTNPHVPAEGAVVYGYDGSTADTYFSAIEGVTFSEIIGGSCGKDANSPISWSFDSETGVLSIGGQGEMAHYGAVANQPWYSYADSITKIVIHKGITILGNLAFQNLKKVTEVSLPDGLLTIGQQSLKATSITQLIIPESVTKINYQALNSCTKLTSLVIPKNVTTFGNQVFGACSALKSIIFLADSNTSISFGTGSGGTFSSATPVVYCNNNASVIAGAATANTPLTCYSLTPSGDANADGSVTWKIDVLTGVMTISGNGAMDNFASTTAAQSSGWYAHRLFVKSLVVEEGVTSLAAYGFANHTNLETVSFPSTLTNIGKYAFTSCSALDNLVIGAGVALNDSCFNKCTSLKTLVFEEGRTSITSRVFAGCTALEEVVIPATVTTIGYTTGSPFNGCTGLKTITFLSKDVTIRPLTADFEANKDKALPTGVIINAPAGGTVEEYAKENGYTFTSTIASGEINGIRWDLPFTGVLTVSGNGAIPDFTKTETAPWFAYKDQITSIVVAEGITVIGKYAFNELKQATSVTLPATLTYIYDHAFRYCHGLVAVNFTASTTELTIGDNAFNQCKSLPTITIPSNVIKISGSSFTQCYVMTEMIFEEGISAIGAKAYHSCYVVNNIVFPESLVTLGYGSTSAFTGDLTALSNLTFLNKDTNIIGTFPANYKDGTKLSITITAPAGGAVQEYATKNGYTFVALGGTPEPDPEPQNPSGAFASGATWEFNPETGLLTISGKGAMDNYSDTNEAPWYEYRESITSVIIENGITTIGQRAFNSTKIAAIVIPDSVGSIGESAFRNCKELASLTIGSGVASIGTYCFNGCTALTSVTVPGNVKSLANYAFNNCSALATIVLEEGVETTSNGTFLGCPITEIVFPKSMLSIGRNDSYSTFAKCTKLEKVIFLNPNTVICTVKEDYISTHGDAIPAGTTVYGYAGSKAETYAAAKGNPFVTMYEPFAYDNNAIMEFTASAVKANAGELLPIVSINRMNDKASATLSFLAVDENGALYLYANGKAEALYDAEGNALILGDETDLSIVYNDKNGTARFYVNRDIPTYGANKTLAINVPVANADFLIRSFSDEIVTAEGVKLENSFAAEDLPAEFAGFQVGENATALRIFAGIDMLYYDNVGFEISLYANGSLVGSKTEYAKTVFSAVRADGETITAEELGFRYIAAVKIFDIDRTEWPAETEVRFVVKTFATIGEEVLYGAERSIYISHDGEKQNFTSYKPAYTGEFIPVLRFIASSDVHITDGAVSEKDGVKVISGGAEKLRNAIEQILSFVANNEKNDGYAKLDALLLAGDIVNTGTDKQYQNAQYIFGNVENGGILPNETQLVVTMGNHDWGNNSALSYNEALAYLAKFESVFGAATRDTVIGGYHFITINVDENLSAKGDNGANMKRPYGYDFSEDTVALATQLIEAAVADTPDKPVFVIQHVATSDTILGSWENYETEDGKIGKNDTSDSAVPTLFELQSKYPNLVVFSGHSHAPINDVASIHQKYFTSLNTGVLGGAAAQSRVDGATLDSMADPTHANYNPNVIETASNNDDVFVIEVDSHNRVRIRIWDTATQTFVGETFMVDSFDPYGFKYTEGRYDDSDIFFDDDAAITESAVTANAITITFPMVSADSVVARVYKIVATDADGNEVVGYVAPEYYTGVVAPITMTMTGLKPNTEYDFEVYAINPMYSYNVLDKGAIWSAPITGTFTTENERLVEGGDLITLLLDSKTGTAVNAGSNKVSSTVNGTPAVSFDPVIGMDVITFNGDNTQSVAHGFSSVMDKLTDGFSVEAFFKIDEEPTGTVVAFGAMQSCAFGLVLDQSKGTFRFDIHNGSTYKKIYSTTLYETNTYYHVVCSFDGTTAYLYVNGVLEGSIALGGELYLRDSHCTLQLGADYKNTGNKIDSASKTTFAKFNLYSDPMSAAEVAEAYAKLPRKNAVILEMKQTTANKGGTYGDFSVYVQTSDPSGKYYVRYDFVYKHSTTATGNADSGNDLDMFRIAGAYLVEVSAVNETAVTVEKVITKVLQDGEIALAIKENRDDNKDGTNDIVDFVGGFHGDEEILAGAVALAADGVTYFPGTEAKAVVCTTLTFHQKTVLDRCNTDVQVMTHDQKYTITSAGLSVLRSVEWLTGDFTLLASDSKGSNSYLQLFTMYRNWEGNAVCDTISTYDGNGNLLGTTTISGAVEKERTELHSADARCAKYSSTTTGISATVSFKTLNDQVKANGAWIKVRNDDKGDNKWYASFSSAQNGLTPAQGEVWEIEAYYHIDYVNPNN
ncbi:MAG: leucine-rich repeat protein [Clostridia bacterium]|nr:leucine-rich repeat protein [Clostridia bacterium]